ncbi:unnamed protein product [Effrenium voratum]|nr:unnamed protein product [Effrenium voratum]
MIAMRCGHVTTSQMQTLSRLPPTAWHYIERPRSPRRKASLRAGAALASASLGWRLKRPVSRKAADLPEGFGDGEVMQDLPGFVSVPPEVLPAIRSFAEQHRSDRVVTWITGKRVQVYLTGVKSEAFLDYVASHQHREVLERFLSQLRGALEQVATANGGEASEDMCALVGAEEMQVPHTDLLPGQVQVILALMPTRPTLVYDPQLPRPSREEIAKMMGVNARELLEEGTFGLVYNSFPLVLPVDHVYQRMVPAYTSNFAAGDAVQIKDGIVHAGPGPDEPEGDPRVVIFMTYRTTRPEHYELTFQAKLWDWASHPAIDPQIAYQRLQEVYNFGKENNMDIQPWTYYPPESLEACKMLCTMPGLDETTVELLVEEWREMLYDDNLQIVDQDQDKGELQNA